MEETADDPGAVQLEGIAGQLEQTMVEPGSREPCLKPPESNLDENVGDGSKKTVACAPIMVLPSEHSFCANTPCCAYCAIPCKGGDKTERTAKGCFETNFPGV